MLKYNMNSIRITYNIHIIQHDTPSSPHVDNINSDKLRPIKLGYDINFY